MTCGNLHTKYCFHALHFRGSSQDHLLLSYEEWNSRRKQDKSQGGVRGNGQTAEEEVEARESRGAGQRQWAGTELERGRQATRETKERPISFSALYAMLLGTFLRTAQVETMMNKGYESHDRQRKPLLKLGYLGKGLSKIWGQLVCHHQRNGKYSARMQEWDQKLLTNVLYIPYLKTNIFSIGQAEEGGCEVRIKQGTLTPMDHDGSVLMRVQRSPNRLYKIGLKKGVPICLKAEIKDPSWLWHARLGHLNFETMRKLRKSVKGVPTIMQQDRMCEACLAGKHSRQKLPLTVPL
ncbi:hypothetical protein E3N88_09576 [Mikania micrantha]|uniref:Uncharacterized protein n=1 Tax=Mikania micrantha TaxID=192012 RepID=A0A5N6PJF7_9ASTR|nr:hypothetical protein E3N88_09576 [Mikania micrantha]